MYQNIDLFKSVSTGNRTPVAVSSTQCWHFTVLSPHSDTLVSFFSDFKKTNKKSLCCQDKTKVPVNVHPNSGKDMSSWDVSEVSQIISVMQHFQYNVGFIFDSLTLVNMKSQAFFWSLNVCKNIRWDLKIIIVIIKKKTNVTWQLWHLMEYTGLYGETCSSMRAAGFEAAKLLCPISTPRKNFECDFKGKMRDERKTWKPRPFFPIPFQIPSVQW